MEAANIDASLPSSGKARILVVDDEANVLSAVRRELNAPAFGRDRYEIEVFTNPEEALDRARGQDFDLVISDFRMPEMDGLTFLKALGEIQPDCTRLVLSGQTDFDSLIRMINETHIYRFIPKPWSEYFLKSSVTQALRFHRTRLEHRRLADLLREQGLDNKLVESDGPDQILVVDDDKHAIQVLTRDLVSHSRLDDVFGEVRAEINHLPTARLEDGKIQVKNCASPLQALKMADNETFACVIAEYKMPDMDGISLLQAFSEKQPDCARILVGSMVSADNLIDALDLAHIYSYIGKPWQAFELKTSVAQALEHRRLQLENRVFAEMLRAKDINALG